MEILSLRQKNLNNIFQTVTATSILTLCAIRIILLEHLMKKAKKEGWFDNTIFIFMADHIVGIVSFLRNDSIEERFKIPFVIYVPKY